MRSVVFAMLVALGGTAAAQQAPARPGAPGHKSPVRGPGYVTYVGFQKVDDGARVFLRLSSAATPAQLVAGGELVVQLPGFKLDMQNNGRPLDTRWFGTAIVRVRAAEVRDKGVELHITFAEGASPREARVSTAPAEEADAGEYLYLDF
jgi:hypothetical protein